MYRYAGRNKRAHMLRYQDNGISTRGDKLTKALEEPAFARYSPFCVLYAQQVTPSKRHHQRQALRPGQHCSLPKLGVHQVVLSGPQFVAQALPGFHIVNQPLAATKMEYVHVNTCPAHELDLPNNERNVLRVIGGGPFTGNHQDAHARSFPVPNLTLNVASEFAALLVSSSQNISQDEPVQ